MKKQMIALFSLFMIGMIANAQPPVKSAPKKTITKPVVKSSTTTVNKVTPSKTVSDDKTVTKKTTTVAIKRKPRIKKRKSVSKTAAKQ